MQENNSIIIAMLEELLTISKSQHTEQTVNANVDLTPIKELIENGNRKNKEYYDTKTNKLAGFVVNEGGATATDILNLMKIVQETVKDKFDVMLEPEVRIIG